MIKEQGPIKINVPKKKLGVKILENVLGGIAVTTVGIGIAGGVIYYISLIENAMQKYAYQNEKTSSLTTLVTPKPSEVPGTPTPELSGFTWRHINPGETVVTGKNDFIIGDVDINGIAKLYDDNEKTGLIVDIEEDGILVSAKWGADIRTVLNPNYKYEEMIKARDEMLTTGGENHNGLEKVDMVAIKNAQKENEKQLNSNHIYY
jgi:hypothetical protein